MRVFRCSLGRSFSGSDEGGMGACFFSFVISLLAVSLSTSSSGVVQVFVGDW